MIAVFVLDMPHKTILRRIALNTLNREQSFQRSTQKSNRAAMDNNYMLKILAACLLT